MLYTVILFGATDFYQFGSNLMGSTLRQDWLVALGLGACALKKGRPCPGRVPAGLRRAHPRLPRDGRPVLAGAGGVFMGRVAGSSAAGAAHPARIAGRPGRTLRGIAGAAMAVVRPGAGDLGCLRAQGQAGAPGSPKIEMHAVGPSTNNVGLRNLLA